jgi:hypothetical protein
MIAGPEFFQLYDRVFIWPKSLRQYEENVAYFRGDYPNISYGDWTNDQLAAAIFGWYASHRRLNGLGLNKRMISELFWRMEHLELELKARKSRNEKSSENHHEIWDPKDGEEIDSIPEWEDYLANRPLDQKRHSYFCPTDFGDDIVEQLGARLFAAETFILSTGRLCPRGSDYRALSDQLLLDIMILEAEMNGFRRDRDAFDAYPTAIVEELTSRASLELFSPLVDL